MASDPSVTVHITVETPSAIVTETEFMWLSPRNGMPEGLRKAVCAWAERHGLDPNQMPMHYLIVRDVVRCQVRCSYFELDEQGRRIVVVDQHGDGMSFRTVLHVAQGETPPMPWPAEVLALMEETA